MRRTQYDRLSHQQLSFCSISSAINGGSRIASAVMNVCYASSLYRVGRLICVGGSPATKLIYATRRSRIRHTDIRVISLVSGRDANIRL